MGLPARASTAAAVLAALACAAGPARADVLRLENGKILHGTVERGYVNDRDLKVQLFATGGTVRVRWEHLISEDRDRWQVDLGLRQSDEAQELKVDGHKVLFVTGAQSYGLVLNPSSLAPGSTEDVRILAKGKEVSYPRGQIGAVSPASIDLLLVYTPIQAYEKRRDEIAPNTGPAHSDLADYARLVGAYEQCKEHLLEAQKDADFAKTPQGRMLESKLATVDILIRNQSLADELSQVKVTLLQAKAAGDFLKGAKFYLDARDAMYRLTEQYPDKKVQAEFKMPDLQMRVETERRAFFQLRLPPEAYRRLRQAAYDKARESKVRDFPPNIDRQQMAILQAKGTFEGAKQHFTRQVADDLWNGLMRDVGSSERVDKIKALQEKAPERVTDDDKKLLERLTAMEKTLKAELLDYWTNRSKSRFEVTSYGYGTFIVVGTTLNLQRKPPTQQGGQRGGQRGGGGNRQAQDVIKTPDQWWEEAGAQERVNWLLSWFAEKGGLLEVARTWDEPCDSCAGLGYKKSSVASTGEEEAERCKVCNGAKVIKKVRWR